MTLRRNLQKMLINKGQYRLWQDPNEVIVKGFSA
jgi:hypothetical protein